MINDRLIDAGDLPLAVRDFGGEQPPLLLLHDAGGNLATMTTLARALRPRHRVITVDLRGHGRSGDGDWSWDAALGDLAALCVQMELDRPAVAGHGLGGMLAVLWAQRHPETPGVISLDGTPPPTRPEQLPGMERADAALKELHDALADTPAGRVVAADELPDLVERERMAARDRGANEKVWIEGFRRNLRQADGATTVRPSAALAAQVRTAVAELDLPGVYASTTCPVLLVLPTRSSSRPELWTAYRQHLVQQARAVGHLRHLSLQDASAALVVEQPEVLAGLIGDFLAAPDRLR